MSIDWEELLDAQGDELQDAYESLCGDCDEPWDDDDPAPDISWDFIDPDEFLQDWEEEEEDCEEVQDSSSEPASATDERLERLMASPPVPVWEERLNRVRKGLPVRNERAVRVMRAMGAMPLERYLSCLNPFSREYLIVWSIKQKLPENATYQQAADELYKMLKLSGAGKTGAEAAKENQDCIAVFQAIVKPFTQILKDLTRDCT